MMSLRLYCPAELSEAAQGVLDGHAAVGAVAVIKGASKHPAGDLILADIAREGVNHVVDGLLELGLTEEGTIHLSPVDAWVSRRDLEALNTTPGEEADAVVWTEVLARAYDATALTWSFFTFLSLSCLLAAIAIVLDSTLLLVGAVVLGPEFGAIAAIGLALVRRRPELLKRALRILLLGFASAVVVATAFALVVQALGWVSVEHVAGTRANTGFIYHPDQWSVVIAVLAGIAGVLSLTSSSSNALVGVFISVTTLPASGNIALGIAFRQWDQVLGSTAQVLINITGMAVAGWLTLLVQQTVWSRVRARVRR